MKTITLFIGLWMAVLALSAGLAWTEPVVAASYANVQYAGSPATASNGNTLITWMENVDEMLSLRLCLYDQQIQAQWTQPITIENLHPSQCRIIVTPADDFIFTVWKSDGLYAYKVSPDGSQLWGQAGIPVFTSFYTGMFEVTQDYSGGAWFTKYSEYLGYSVVQHVDSNGSRLLPVQGLMLEPSGIETWLPVLYALPDDGVIIAYRNATNTMLKRLSAGGDLVWTDPSVGIGLWEPRFCGFTDNSFALSWRNEDGLWLQRFNFDFIAQWSSPLCVFSDSGWGVGKTIMLKASDACVIVSDGFWSHPLRLQKVSSEGQLVFGEGTELQNESYFLAADNAGGCYAASTSSDIRLARISSTGEQLWGITGIPVCVGVNAERNFNLSFYDGTTTMLWGDWREGYSGIYAQKSLPSGALLLPANGLPIKTSPYAQILFPRVGALQDKSVLLWLQRSKTYGRYQIRMQIVMPDGSFQLQPGGIPLTSNCLNENDPYAPSLIVTPSGEIMVSWIDDLSGLCKIQLYSSSGAPLWGNEAVTVNGISAHSPISYVDGSFIFAMRKQNSSGAYRLYGQKITNGINQWPSEGLLLMADDPDSPFANVGIWGMCGDYLIWERGQVWCLRFNADGSAATGFEPWGKQLSHTSWPFTQGSFSFRLLGENLHCSWYESHLMHPSFNYRGYHFGQQVISPQGQILINAPGVIYEEEGDPIAIPAFRVEVGVGDDYFITGYDSYGDYRLRKHSLSGGLLSDSSPNLYNCPPYSFNQVYYLAGVENGRVFLLADYSNSEIKKVVYLALDPQEQGNPPPGTTVFERPVGQIKDLSLVRSGEEFLLTGAIACTGYGTAGSASRVFLQKIVNPGNPIQDFEAVPVAPFSISRTGPNPFRDETSFQIKTQDTHSILSVNVYNLKGQKVRDLYHGIPGPQTSMRWDGTDSQGKRVGSGVYFFRAVQNGHAVTGKTLLLRK